MEKVVKLKTLDRILKESGSQYVGDAESYVRRKDGVFLGERKKDGNGGGHILNSMIIYFDGYIKIRPINGSYYDYSTIDAKPNFYILESWIDHGPDTSWVDDCFKELFNDL